MGTSQGVSGGHKPMSVRWVQAKECQVGIRQGVSGGYKARSVRWV